MKWNGSFDMLFTFRYGFCFYFDYCGRNIFGDAFIWIQRWCGHPIYRKYTRETIDWTKKQHTLQPTMSINCALCNLLTHAFAFSTAYKYKHWREMKWNGLYTMAIGHNAVAVEASSTNSHQLYSRKKKEATTMNQVQNIQNSPNGMFTLN